MKKGAGIGAVCVAVAALGLWFAGGRQSSANAVRPVEGGCAAVCRSLATRLGAYFRRGGVAAENARLKAENDGLRMALADARTELAAYARLREALGDGGRDFPTNRWLLAPVLSHGGPDGLPGLLRVGRGRAEGVVTNAAVAVPDGLVGRVESVAAHSATVRLVTDPSVRVSCELETDDPAWRPLLAIVEGGSYAAYRGRSALSALYVFKPLRLRHLKQRPALARHAKLVTSGLGGVFPRGLVVGHLKDELSEDETALEREGDVVPAVDFPALEDVFIRRED